MQPTDLGELQAAGLSERQVQQWGSELIQAVERGVANPLIHPMRTPVPSAAYLKRLEALKDWRKKVAAGMEVESDVVLPRDLLLALAEGGREQLQAVMRGSPWRLNRFGEAISEILAPSTPN